MKKTRIWVVEMGDGFSWTPCKVCWSKQEADAVKKKYSMATKKTVRVTRYVNDDQVPRLNVVR